MRTITNDYRDAEILDLGTGFETGPFLVTQTGVGPNDPVPKHICSCFVQMDNGWTSTPMPAKENQKQWTSSSFARWAK